jgi:hypothetical protein
MREAEQLAAALDERRLIGNSAAPALNRWPFKASSGLTDFQADGHLRTDSTAHVLALRLAGQWPAGRARHRQAASSPRRSMKRTTSSRPWRVRRLLIT